MPGPAPAGRRSRPSSCSLLLRRGADQEAVTRSYWGWGGSLHREKRAQDRTTFSSLTPKTSTEPPEGGEARGQSEREAGGEARRGARGLAAGPSRESPQASRWAEEEGRAGATGCVPWDSGRRCSCPEEPSASLALGVGRAGVRSLGLGTLVRVDREGECSAPGGLRQEVAGGRASKRAHLTVTSGFSRSDRSEPQSQAAGGPEAREKAGLNRRTKARPSRVGQLCPLRRIPFRASRRTGLRRPPSPVLPLRVHLRSLREGRSRRRSRGLAHHLQARKAGPACGPAPGRSVGGPFASCSSPTRSCVLQQGTNRKV